MKSFIYREGAKPGAIVPSCWGPFDSFEAAREAAGKLRPGSYVVTDGGTPREVVTISTPTVTSAPAG